ncbi:hypothetical protein LOD99_12205 [Oopsacas minuta]|uniref:Gustatory receptor n=1 Tax=Oopsacas minuta TaxID=111878 RepID=A0AAV7JEH6_9METZ|nr:hypothetical protein LOD99_12205 [Oopsacas minuta]
MSSIVYENTSPEQKATPIPKPRRLFNIPENTQTEIGFTDVLQTSEIQTLGQTVFENIGVEIERSAIPTSQPTVCATKPDTTIILTPRNASKYHNCLLSTLDIITLQLVHIFIQESFPNIHKYIPVVAKRFLQICNVLLFIVLTAESTREFILDSQEGNFEPSTQNFVTGKVLTNSVVIFLAFSLMSFASLIFLYTHSDIFRSSNVTFHGCNRASWRKQIFPALLYIGIIAIIEFTLLWKLFFTLLFYSFRLEYAFIFVAPFVICYFIVWHFTPFILCITIRSICKQLQYETTDLIKKSQKILTGKLASTESIAIIFYEHLENVNRIASKLRHIIPVVILATLAVCISIFVSAFNHQGGILAFTDDPSLINGVIPRFMYLWLVFASYSFLITILFMTQSISKLNSLLNKFSEIVLQDKEVLEYLNDQANGQNINEIQDNLLLISSSKIRFTAALFGDFTYGVFYTLIVAALTFTIPFLWRFEYFVTHLEQVLYLYTQP